MSELLDGLLLGLIAGVVLGELLAFVTLAFFHGAARLRDRALDYGEDS